MEKLYNPTIDIITVVFNAKAELERTLSSVFSQNYANLNLIVIDGGSNDGTQELIKNNSDKFKFWISESDNGIYDAMNKGLNHATGDYVWFINAGDEIYSKNTLSEIFYNEEKFDAYYGDVMYINSERKELGRRKLKSPPKDLSWKSFINGMVVSHQSLIIKRDKAAIYDLTFRHVSDLDWCIRSLKNCSTVNNTNLILSKFLVGGYSKKNIVKSNTERLKILMRHFNFLSVFYSQNILFVKFLFYYLTTKNKYY